MLKLKAKLKLEDIVGDANIAERLSKADLGLIAADVCEGAITDRDSRARWEQLTKKVLRMASLEKEKKNTPFEDASNVKLPMMTTAVLQFAASTFPEVIKQREVMHSSVVGDDPTNAKHQVASVIQNHMNYQLLVENNEFATNLDKLLHTYSLVGIIFKKTFYDPIRQQNRSELCHFEDLYINADAKSAKQARRITHVLKLYPNDIWGQVRYGVFCSLKKEDLEVDSTESGIDNRHIVYEQHRYLDLDNDGYSEPYIVTVLKDSQKVLRIRARFTAGSIKRNDKGQVYRITPQHFFTDYHFIPNPDGSFYSLGYGHLLYNLNHCGNTLFNQITDAGILANNSTGFVGGDLRIQGGEIEARMGKIMKLQTSTNSKISDSIHMLQFPPPNPVLLQLLNVVLDQAKDLVSINAPNTGQAQVQNVTASVMQSQIQNGSTIRTGILHRLVRSMQEEFEKLYELNAIFLDPQQQFMVPGRNTPLTAQDYADASLILKPVADPNLASDELRLGQVQALQEMMNNPGLNQYLNGFGIAQLSLESMKVQPMNQVLKPPDPNAAPPPEILELQSKMDIASKQLQLDAHRLDLQQQDVLIRAHLAEGQAAVDHAQSVLALAQASVVGQQTELQEKKINSDAIMQGMKSEVDMQKAHLAARAKMAVEASKPRPQPKEAK